MTPKKITPADPATKAPAGAPAETARATSNRSTDKTKIASRKTAVKRNPGG